MSDALASRRSNNFDALRLGAALTVVVSHAWPLTGRAGSPTFGGVLLAHIAVYVFFSISGYLISTSWNNSKTVLGYFARRVARIFPAIVVLVLVTVLIIGPLSTSKSLIGYFSSTETWSYLSALVLAPTYSLPGVFKANPTTAVNGSLWSLGPEFVCYVIVALVGLAAWRIFASRRGANMAIFACLAVSLAALFWGSDIKALHDASGAMVFFMLGAIIAQSKVRLNLWLAIPMLAVWGATGLFFHEAGMWVAWPVISYVSIAAGTRGTAFLRHSGRFGDFSYGIYLWGFPVQQLTFSLAPTMGLLPNLLIVIAATGAIAIASWCVVERRAIRLGRAVDKVLAYRASQI